MSIYFASPPPTHQPLHRPLHPLYNRPHHLLPQHPLQPRKSQHAAPISPRNRRAHNRRPRNIRRLAKHAPAHLPAALLPPSYLHQPQVRQLKRHLPFLPDLLGVELVHVGHVAQEGDWVVGALLRKLGLYGGAYGACVVPWEGGGVSTTANVRVRIL